jgi:hypothetical protein
MTTIPVLAALVILAPVSGPPEGFTSQSITGRVIDAADHGVPRLMVQAIHDDAEHTGRAHALTREDGTFELRVSDNTPVNVAVGSGRTGFAFQAGVRPGAQNVMLRLIPGGAVRVLVLGPRGEPKAGVSVQGPVSLDGAHFLELNAARTGTDGTAELAVPAGVVEVVLRRSDGRTLTHLREKVTAGTTVEIKAAVDDP